MTCFIFLAFIGSKGTVTISSPYSEDVLTLKFSLEDVLKFVTGAPSTPPMGFEPSPSIQFHSDSDLPIANTCSNTLFLPRDSLSDEDFNYNVISGIVNSAGFGRI